MTCSFTLDFSPNAFSISAGNSHYVAWAHFHGEFLYQTVNLNKSFLARRFVTLCALPTLLFDDSILHQSKHHAKGNSKESQKTSVCTCEQVLVFPGRSPVGCALPISRHQHQHTRCLVWPPGGKIRGTRPSGVTYPQRQDGVTNPPPLGLLGWMGTSPWYCWAGRTMVWIDMHMSGLWNYLQHATEDKTEPVGRRERVPVHSPSCAKMSPLL